MAEDPNVTASRAYNESKAQMDRNRHSSNPGMTGVSSTNPGGGHSSPQSTEKVCFPAGTLIQTPLGERDIASLEAGDLVWGIDPLRHASARRVLRAVRHESAQLWVVRFADGSEVKTTGFHSFALDGQTWRRASELQVGDWVESYGPEGRFRRLVQVSKRLDCSAPVFNLIVEGDFTFIANSALVNSFTTLRALRAFAWTAYDKVCGWARIQPMSHQA